MDFWRRHTSDYAAADALLSSRKMDAPHVWLRCRKRFIPQTNGPLNLGVTHRWIWIWIYPSCDPMGYPINKRGDHSTLLECVSKLASRAQAASNGLWRLFHKICHQKWMQHNSCFRMWCKNEHGAPTAEWAQVAGSKPCQAQVQKLTLEKRLHKE